MLLTPGTSALAAESTRLLYGTDFENFTVGDDQLVGFDGWEGDNIGERVHGIDQSIVTGLGKTAFLGFSPPSDHFVRVFRPVDYDPVAEGTPVVEFFALVGIQESTAGGDDYFYLTVLNSERQALAAIRFQAGPSGIQTWRFDGEVMHPEIGGFIPGEVAPVLAQIDFAENRWSVQWDGVPLIDNAPFTALSTTRDLGAMAAEWQLADPANPGNNWLLFDQWSIEAVLPAALVLTHAGPNPDGTYSISWSGPPGATFVVEYSPDLLSWHDDLPGAVIDSSNGGPLTFTDATTTNEAGQRFYRIVHMTGS
ncbi:hypothetical protein BH23VER1_BH23VER1_03660 [soil metagenome]